MTIQLQEEQLVNEDGMWYGIHVTVRGTNDVQDTLAALVEQYGEERVYGSQSIIDQFRWSFDSSDAAEATAMWQEHVASHYGLAYASQSCIFCKAAGWIE